MIRQNSEDRRHRLENEVRKPETHASRCIPRLRSEKGVVLVVVIVLSAVALLIMTTLIYMVTTGTQISAHQKNYKTALEAGIGCGGEIFYTLINTRAHGGKIAFLTNELSDYNINMLVETPSTCSGMVSLATYTGFAARLMSSSTTWENCDRFITIDPADASTYDMKTQCGTTTRYDTYAKIVATSPGNTGGDDDLVNRGVIDTGKIAVQPMPYLYAIEVYSENSSKVGERAKLSILYQY